jgi:hypothetical protein
MEERPPFLVSIISVVACGILVIPIFAIQAPDWQDFTAITALGIAVAGAALLVGALTGFLFGIPRKLQQERLAPSEEVDQEKAAAREESALYGGNTNLEQISDWLTKILVGVGLTQISALGGALQKVADVAAPGFGGFVSSGPFAVSLVLYFMVSGFLIGYLWTRLFLGRALTAAERAVSLKKQLSRLEQQAHADARALRLGGQQLSGDDADLPGQAELDEAVKGASGDTRSHIFYRAQLQRWRNWKEEVTKPVMERTIPIFRALIASDTEHRYHENHGQLGYALKDKRDADCAEAERELSTAIALRGDAREHNWHIYEFNRALCRIKLDPGFKSESPSSAEAKSRIIADLAVGVEDPWISELVEKDPDINKWLRLNKLSTDDIDG